MEIRNMMISNMEIRNMEIRSMEIRNMEIRNMDISNTEYPFTSKMENKKIDPKIEDGDSGYQVSRLATLDNTKFFCPIEYIYDYLPPQVNWLKAQPISLRCSFTAHEEQSKLTFINHQAQEQHSILLDTQAANLPLHTGLAEFRQSKHWKASEQATKELLEIFAQDRRCGEVLLQDGQTMASVAEEQLTPGFIHTYSRFPVYLFIEADEDRLKLVAESVILIFAFDDVWESASQKTIADYREEFVARLRGEVPVTTSDTPLERRLSAIRQGLLAGDAEQGNGGAEVLQTVIDFCFHPDPPREEFRSVRDYLDYRWGDAAISFVFACAKFSIRSTVSEHNPHLHRIIHHIGDQISIVNDLASYAMEKARFETGKAKSLINIVAVIMAIERVDADVAKSMAYAWQLCMEQEVLKDLEGLRKGREEGLKRKKREREKREEEGKKEECNGLGIEEKEREEEREEEECWRFIDAWLLVASGNLLTSVVMSRYGGEGARIA